MRSVGHVPIGWLNIARESFHLDILCLSSINKSTGKLTIRSVFPANLLTQPLSQIMLDDQQKDHHRSPKPRLQVRIRPAEAEPIATVHSATASSLKNTLAEVAGKERTIQPDSDTFHDGNKTTEASPTKSIPVWSSDNLPSALQWIPANWSWSKWKPVLRSALAAWISLLFFLIPTTLNAMGEVSFSFFPPLPFRLI